MKKVLPLCYKPEIKLECWTFMRTSIIRAYNQFDDWFVHHLNNIYINSNFECDFGEFGNKYNVIKHYEEVLDFEEQLYTDLDENNLISRLCNLINDNKYIIMDLDSYKIYDFADSTFIAQFLIYGYDDDKKVFYSPSIHGGRWHEVEIKWDSLINAFKVRKNFGYEDLLKTITRQNPYPMLIVSPKANITPKIHLSKFYNDIKSNLKQSNELYQLANKNYYFRNGILGVYSGLKELIQLIFNNKYDIDNLTYDHGLLSGFCKLLECSLMISKAIKRIDEYYNLDFPESIFEQQNIVVKNNEQLKNIILKYLLNFNKETLKDVISVLDKTKKIEEECFYDIVSTIEKYFVKPSEAL